ncbi:branched-chain amino acid ABC transporter permease [Nocardioides sp.]|uniref:branched-chain amino acid ABC transporter permease n=1 Tax=Nocardioides sp. TaxID=35761 RepID=UPI002732A447|nr:branched-chain amino acid ABC transporter permease [Nocardioides sp.]MDP3894916.1 branched-chain amino acid ABC transporter permease [Nocardioides sp.]
MSDKDQIDFQDEGDIVKDELPEELVEPDRGPSGRKAAILTAIGVATVSLMGVVATYMSGPFPNILQAVLREAISPQTAAVAIAVIGLNIHFGFTGLLNIGQAGFMLLGAYGFAIAVAEGVPLPLAVLVGLGASVLFALFLGIPTLKLRGDYLAIVTISAAEIIRYVGRLSQLTDVTGGSQGLPGGRYREPFTSLSFFGSGRTTLGPFTYQNTGVDGWWVRFVAWTIVLICVVVVWLLVRSPWGRLLRGIREDEDAIRSLGKNVYAVKMQALIIGGALGALGGIVYVLPASVQPDAMGRSLTFFIWTALLLGGAATIFGPVLGTILFFSVRILVRGVTNAYVPDSILNSQQTEQFSWVVVGVALMLLVIFRPQGILGNKRELQFNG